MTIDTLKYSIRHQKNKRTLIQNHKNSGEYPIETQIIYRTEERDISIVYYISRL